MTFRKSRILAGALALGLAAGTATGAAAGTLVVSADEWPLSNSAFSLAPTTAQFVANLVSEFGTRIHAYSNNFGYTQSSLATAMTTAGATYTTGLGITFDLPTLQTYDAIFLGGNYLTAPQKGVLTSYLNGGGGVYISAGTGNGGAAGEAAAWNDFLAPYGIQLQPVYTGYSGILSGGVDPLFAGVASLFMQNPNGLTGNVVCCTQEDAFSVVRMTMPAIPVPASGVLLGTALAGAAAGALRRRRG